MGICDFLDKHGVVYTHHKHVPVFTCDEVKKLSPAMEKLVNKNLFLVDDSGRYYLLVLPEMKRLSTRTFRQYATTKKVRFGSDAELWDVLKLKPGGVTPLGLINDEKKQVTLLIDEDMWHAPAVGFHPETNAETIELTQEMFRKFLDATDVKPAIVTF